MRLFIARHGKASPDSSTGLDRDRELKGRGERQASFLGERLAPHEPTLILTSPFARARRTADLIHAACDADLRESEVLEVDRPVSGVVELITAHTSSDPLVLVGHNPQLSTLVGVLARGVGGDGLGLRTGECAVIDLDPAFPLGRGTLVETIRLVEDD